MEFIDLKSQYENYKEKIDARIHKVLDHGKYIMGPEINELENILAEFIKVKYCITVASGTDSLEIALRALKIGLGDEVITVPFSWISTVEVICQVGATPVLVDIDPNYYTIDVDKLESKINNKTKAIIPVSLFGQMPDMEKINQIASKYKIPVIEDAAQSFGAKQNNIMSCGSSTIGSTSFFPAKTLGCYGDGGALFTNDLELANTIRAIRTHGGINRHEHTHIGMNGRFDTLQAAIILAKWEFFEEELEHRKRIGQYYNEMLEPYFKTPELFKGNTHVYGQYTIRVKAFDRAKIIEKLSANGIPSGVYYPKSIHQQPAFSYLGYKYGDFPESEKASSEVLSLPMHPFLKKEEQDVVINCLIDSIK